MHWHQNPRQVSRPPQNLECCKSKSFYCAVSFISINPLTVTIISTHCVCPHYYHNQSRGSSAGNTLLNTEKNTLVALFWGACVGSDKPVLCPNITAMQIYPHIPLFFIYFLTNPDCLTRHHALKGFRMSVCTLAYSLSIKYRLWLPQQPTCLFLHDNEHEGAWIKSSKLFLKKEGVISKCHLRGVWRIRSLVDHVIRTQAFS